MKYKIILFLALLVFAFAAASLSAGEDAEKIHETKMVVALKTDDFELIETDISDLEVGQSEIITTESGKTIDLLRTVDGVEIYVDGVLLETGLAEFDGDHGDHKVIHKKVEIICDDDEDCADIDLDTLHGEAHRVVMIHQDHDGMEIHGDEDMELHSGEHAEKVIVIRKKIATD